jgi:hypothetical protein
VRHASYGGKTKFTTGIKLVMDTMKENWGGFLMRNVDAGNKILA